MGENFIDRSTANNVGEKQKKHFSSPDWKNKKQDG